MSERTAKEAAPCWCGSVHPGRPDSPRETCRVIGHLMLAHLRIPQAAAWLAGFLPQPAQPPTWDHCPPAASHTCEWCRRAIPPGVDDAE